MKKRFTPLIKKSIQVLLLLCTHIRVWAIDSTTASTIDTTASMFTRPWIWIAAAVVTAIVLLGPFKEEGREIVIVRKKATRDKEE
jgi:hypothetical protein